MRRRAKARRRNTLSTDEGDLLRCDADQVLSEHPTLAKRNFYPIFSLFFAVLRFCHCLALGCAKATQNRIGASKWVSSADFFSILAEATIENRRHEAKNREKNPRPNIFES